MVGIKGRSGIYTRSQETKDNLRKVMTGRKLSEQHKRKIGIANLGKTRVGHIAWNKGIKGVFKHSNETKHKIGIASSLFMKGRIRPKEVVKKQAKTLRESYASGRIKVWSEGKKNVYSQFSRDKMSKIRKRLIKENPRLKEVLIESRRKLILPKKDTSIEVRIQNYLRELNIDFFTHQYIKEIEHGYQCDILIPFMNLVIECDGDYWHKYPIGREIDHIRTKELLEKGFKVLRLWEFEINQMSLDKFKERLEALP